MPSAEEVTNAYAMFYVTTLQRIASASSITTYKGSWKDLAWASDQGPSHDSMFPAWLSNDLKASSYTVVKSLLNGDTAAALRGNSTLRRDGKSAFWSFQGRDAALADYANAIAIGDMLGVDTKKMGFKVTSPHARIVP